MSNIKNFYHDQIEKEMKNNFIKIELTEKQLELVMDSIDIYIDINLNCCEDDILKLGGDLIDIKNFINKQRGV